ncbi:MULTISPECIES: acyl-CoA dehydrogenase [unclassified Cryobacterium]|uniref:acyl-CoA dehydrogenase n=1 Tax=unclassified Cryobacterium TaxID=2649013 RepID=UPI002B22E9C7|nr:MULTISPECIES: acyl-CoA dehydrogenase [unclassified Cryobacterium]MEA9999504.1 acyl-CoA dehydrogenase [Cryobacterium sp. RTS3]MEB0267201.1 acyl-CoA dehydrogenase [Cryobacterium sp. 10I5]
MNQRNFDSESAPVWLGTPGDREASEQLRVVADEALLVNGDTGRALRLAMHLGSRLPAIGEGDTRRLFETLATVSAADLSAARVTDGHLAALSVLGQASVEPAQLPGGETDRIRSWGVFSAEARGTRLDASESEQGWRLDGLKPWCSLASSLSNALVTAHTSSQALRLFAVDLTAPGITVLEDTWVGRGLPSITSGPVDFRGVPAVAIREDNWYFDRPGYAWAGIGVAACWFGGAVGIARRVFRGAQEWPADQIALAHLGAIDVALSACGGALSAAAASIDDGSATGQAGALLAARVRGLVARSVEEVIARAGHALGPWPLAFEARHSQRVADLELYVRQHHAEHDEAALGTLLLDGGSVPGGGPSPW